MAAAAASMDNLVDPSSLAAGSSPCREPDYGQVLRVTDGDTITVLTGRGEERVRLIGIDAPEVDHDGRDDECWAEEAADFVDDTLQGVARDLASYGFENFHHFGTAELRPKMNWKLVIDTFLESYHIKVLHHASIASLIESNIQTFDSFGLNHRGIYVRKNFDELRAQPESDWNILPYTTMVYVLFPNTVLVVQQQQIETWRVYPDGDDPNLAKMHLSLYAPEAPATESAVRHWRNNMDLLKRVVNEEDFTLGEKMQMGFHSPAQEHVTFGRNEPSLAHFHGSLDSALGLRAAAE